METTAAEEVTGICRDLLRIDTTNTGDQSTTVGERVAAEYVAARLDEAGIEYELVKAPLRRSKREEVKRLTGQEMVPVIEFEDGTAVREEGKVFVEQIRSGRLFDGHSGDPGAAT